MSSTNWLTKPKYSQSGGTQTAVRKDIKVPAGHVIVSDKWTATQLTDELKKLTSFRLESHLGIVDFHLPGGLTVLYVSEADLVSGSSYKQRMAKFKSSKMSRSLVFAEVTPTSDQYFQEAQKFIVVNLRLDVVVVSSQKDAAAALHHMVMSGSQQSANPLLVKHRLPPAEVTMAKVLQAIPNLGQVKVHALMQKFSNVLSISKASVDELASVLTISDAQSVYTFFHDKSSV